MSPRGAAKRRQAFRRGFRTKAEALAELDAIKHATRTGSYVAPDQTATGDYMLRWVDGLPAAGRQPSTVAGYRDMIGRHVIGSDVGDTLLQGLAAVQLDQLYAAMLERGLSPRTVRYLHSIIRKALGDAERKGLVARNVARLADPPATRSTRAPEHAVWSPDELRAFLEHVGGTRHAALLHLAAMTGLRRSELCGMRWVDVDLDAGLLRVRQGLTVTYPKVDGKRTTVLEVGDVKTARSRRTIDLDLTTVAVLRQHRKDSLEERLAMGDGFTDRGFVFTHPDGSPWNPATISQAFGRLVASSGLRPVRFHDLRHGHATHLLTAGVNPKIVSDRLGHSSVAFTLDTYAHVDAAAQVASLVFGSL